MQTTWAQQINPILENPLVKGLILPNIALAIGTNVINHKLGRKLQGYYITRKRAAAQIYDQQDSNQTPQLTLVLVSDAVVTIDLAVF
jgi:hypothetical protein